MGLYLDPINQYVLGDICCLDSSQEFGKVRVHGMEFGCQIW